MSGKLSFIILDIYRRTPHEAPYGTRQFLNVGFPSVYRKAKIFLRPPHTPGRVHVYFSQDEALPLGIASNDFLLIYSVVIRKFPTRRDGAQAVMGHKAGFDVGLSEHVHSDKNFP